MTIEMVPLRPRIIVNSFPKSGTHLAVRMAALLAHRQKPIWWIGTYEDHSWTLDWKDQDYYINIIKGQPSGTWMMGHMGYDPAIVDAMAEMNTAMIFVYRDLRDVAVSQAYHIEAADNEHTIWHSGKDEYMALPDHQARIRAVIEGLGQWPGIIPRWEEYAPWLDVPTVMKARFEDMISDPRKVAGDFINYVTTTTAGAELPMIYQQNFIDAVDKAFELMTEEDAPGKRRGQVGDWHFEFNDKTKKAFDRHAGDWMERLGYGE